MLLVQLQQDRPIVTDMSVNYTKMFHLSGIRRSHRVLVLGAGNVQLQRHLQRQARHAVEHDGANEDRVTGPVDRAIGTDVNERTGGRGPQLEQLAHFVVRCVGDDFDALRYFESGGERDRRVAAD